MAPWVAAGFGDFWHDTVTTMLELPPLRFADTLYTLVLNETGVQLPIVVVGLAVLAVLVAAVVTLRRRPVGLAGVLTWCAAVLIVANLVNKQAFYNQFWLVGALLLLAVAAAAGALSPAGPSDRPERRSRPAGPSAAAPAPPSPSGG
jgi:peptidoglycan/LPS O-acetylase OafA/YrhL